MPGNDPAQRREGRWQKPADERTPPSGSEDVRGYAVDDDEISDEPSPAFVPPVLPMPGQTLITGWPDPGPPVIDPATQGAWPGPKQTPPETPERS